jgi:hypothetical protein
MAGELSFEREEQFGLKLILLILSAVKSVMGLVLFKIPIAGAKMITIPWDGDVIAEWHVHVE